MCVLAKWKIDCLAVKSRQRKTINSCDLRVKESRDIEAAKVCKSAQLPWLRRVGQEKSLSEVKVKVKSECYKSKTSYGKSEIWKEDEGGGGIEGMFYGAYNRQGRQMTPASLDCNWFIMMIRRKSDWLAWLMMCWLYRWVLCNVITWF